MDRERYARHLSLAEVGESGQRRLLSARVALVGMGGLGCPSAQYLAAAGVGHLGLFDPDRVALSNLQRQLLYTEADVGQPKVNVAARRLAELNPDIVVTPHATRIRRDNAAFLLQNYDVILDCSDNFAARDALNEASLTSSVPLVSAAIFGFEGQVAVFNHKGSGCYRCLYPADPTSARDCSAVGVLGALCGVLGTLQATEALKLVLGLGESLAGRVLAYDSLAVRFSTFAFSRRRGCCACQHPAHRRRTLHYEDRHSGFG